MRKTSYTAVAALVGLGLSLGWSTAAFAYGPNAPSLATDPSTVCLGAAFAVSGANLTPTESITLALDTSSPVTLGTANTDPTGAFLTTVTLPSNTTPGTYSVTATGGAGDSSTSVVTAKNCAGGIAFTAASTGGLAFTGADIAAIASVGAIALALGGMLVLTGRRRRSTAE
jgi:hypothetical protein